MIHKFYYVNGGACRYMFELSKLLEKNGHEVVPFSMQHPRNHPTPYEKDFVSNISFQGMNFAQKLLKAPGITKRVIYSKEARNALERLIEREKPDLAHVHMIDHQLSPSIFDALKKFGIPTIQTVHQYKMVCPNYSLYIYRNHERCTRCVEGSFFNAVKHRCHKDSLVGSSIVAFESAFHKRRGTYDMVDLFHTPSQFTEQLYLRHGVPQERVWQQFYTINMEDYPYSPDFEDYFVFYGRVAQEKGVMTLLQALDKVRMSKLKVVGEGPHIPELQSFVKEKGLEDRVEFTGYKQGKELHDLVAGAKFVVAPSLWHDNSPLVMYESFSRGKPVVGSRTGGIPEMVRDHVTGRQFDPGDHEALAEILSELLQDDALVLEMGRNARRLAEEEFAPDVHYQKMKSAYDKLLNGSR